MTWPIDSESRRDVPDRYRDAIEIFAFVTRVGLDEITGANAPTQNRVVEPDADGLNPQYARRIKILQERLDAMCRRWPDQ